MAIVVHAKALGSRVHGFDTSGTQRIKMYQTFTFGTTYLTRGIAEVPTTVFANSPHLKPYPKNSSSTNRE